jgi:hypothetical protein
MAENENSPSVGKKVFFLHPSAFVQNQVIAELAQEEYEVYVLKDPNKLRQALFLYPDSIMFASINEVMKEDAWAELIRDLMGNPETARVQIGVIASMNNDSIRQKYMEEYKVPCGYTVIKSDYHAAIKQLTEILESVNAKGRRKHIRMIMEKDANTTINIPIGGNYKNGVIKDISVVGFSCSFSDDPGLAKNGLFADMQLRLQSQLINAEGIVFGARVEGNEKVYVILFTQRIDPSVRTKIRQYIRNRLQTRMDQELK